ncbi:N-acetylmuramoyl-L-alanine amidase [Candidatus Dependentiae bacterium]|nr:N-acetylmuramoyl-L-alanine amidase [Candidatus Dependentiae bacterium]
MILQSIITAQQIQEKTNRQVHEIGHDAQRKIIYSTTTTKPTHIVLTFSGQETLEKTIKSLEKQGLAYNFIIETDGKIYPITKENESLDEALLHRPFSVGISGKVINGHYEERDMNSVSVTIAIVGKDIHPVTSQQETALTQLIAWLSEKFEITPNCVDDYGVIAYPYGRRNTQENLPWKNLAEKNLTIWPDAKYMKNNPIDHQKIKNIPVYNIAAGLRKIGYLSPITNNPEQTEFKKALTTFQKHYQCQETNGTITSDTVEKLNDIIRQLELLNPSFKDIYPPSL